MKKNIMNKNIMKKNSKKTISKITGGELDNTILFIILAVIIIIVFGLGFLYIYDSSILENYNPITYFSQTFTSFTK